MRLLPLMLGFLVAVPAHAWAQPDEEEAEGGPIALPGSPDAAGAIGLDILGGAATLGGVAGCRAAQFAAMKVAPRLAGFELRGELIDEDADVRAFVDAAIEASTTPKSWSEGTCKSVRTVADQLRYRLDLLENLRDDGVYLVLGLRPITLVRRVSVSGNLAILELFTGRDPIFKEEILRRTRLRPGDNIEDDPALRRAQLVDEEQRIEEYLARRGYVDAKVNLAVEPLADKHQVNLDVKLSKGASYTVGDIEVVGNTAVTTEEIQDLMAQRVCPLDLCLWKGRFSYDRLKSDVDKVRALYHERGFPGVRVRTDFAMDKSPDRRSETVPIKVTINERKKLDVDFDGLDDKSPETLKKVLTFNAAGAYDDFEAESSARAILSKYQSDGRFQTLVDFQRIKLDPDYDRLIFHVDEGNEIAEITFTGNTTFPDERLRTVVSTRPFPGFWGLIGSGGYVTTPQLELDLKALVEFYREAGFPHATAEVQVAQHPALLGALGAVAAQTTAVDGGEPLYLRYDVEEGVRDVVAQLELTGNKALATTEVLAAATLALAPGKPFIAGRVKDDVNALRRVYFDRGYLTVDVRAEVSGTGPNVRLVYKIREGKPVRFGRVLVRGNFKTKSWVVADQLDLDAGDLLTIDALDHGTFQLRSTNLFASVQPPKLIGKETVNIVLDVEERYDNTAEAEVGFGYSTDYSFFGSAVLGLRNLGGYGVSFVISGELGVTRARAQATLTFPIWVMRKALAVPLQLDLSARYRSDDTERFGRLKTEGFSATLSRKLGDGVYLSFKYDLSRFGRSTELLRPAGADQDLSTSPITTRTASLGPVLLVDQRADKVTGRLSPLTPSSGYLLSAAVSVASTYLAGTDDFVKVAFAGQHFLPLGRRVVITNTVRYDQGFPLGDSVLLPDVERFTAGGDTTVRGYEDERLHTGSIGNPLAPPGVFESYRTIPAGGNIRVIHNLDVQVTVIDKLSIASAIFLDSGVVTSAWNGFRANKVRQGLGIALVRWLAPIGSLGLEYAFPLQPQLGDDPTGRIHFNFGFVF